MKELTKDQVKQLKIIATRETVILELTNKDLQLQTEIIALLKQQNNELNTLSKSISQ